MSSKLEKTYIPHYIIDQKLPKMAQKMLNYYDDNFSICLVGIMKGGLWTMYRLLEYLHLELPINKDHNITIGHVGFSSYNEMTHTQEMRCTYMLDLVPDDMRKKHVWLVDDIFDSGNTAKAAHAEINKTLPLNATLNMTTLVTKHIKKPDVYGFVVNPNQFIVGCGMGLDERYRSFPWLTSINELGVQDV